MWSKEDSSASQGHQHAGWSSVSLALEPSGKRRVELSEGRTPKKKVFTHIDDADVDQERARAHAQILVSEGSSAAEAGETKTALAKFDQSLFFNPENATCHEMKAQVLNSLGRSWDAVQAALKATEIRPDWSEAWVTLAQCQGNFGEPELALTSLFKAREAASDSSLLSQEAREWEQLSAARKADKTSQQARVSVLDPEKPE